MPIRWNPEPVKEALDHIEALLGEVTPFFLDMVREVEKGVATPNLPTYMSERLKTLARNVEEFQKRCERDMRLAREQIPSSPVSQKRPQDGPSLF